MLRIIKIIPFVKLLAIAKVLLIARRAIMRLTPDERRRMRTLVLLGPKMGKADRDELRILLSKLEPRAFAVAAAEVITPLPRSLKRLLQ